ncbi:MAG TPA: outer membrane beta-barrel protein [Stellaceae bacterium]|nr:outer membrane beta-barrel protein [Stellaceae bacterium]
MRGTFESGPDDTAPDVSLDKRLAERQLAIGAQFGAVSLTPSLQLDESLNDNIFAAPSGKRADAISTITGRTSLDYSKGVNTLDIQGWLAGHIYAVHSTENSWEGVVQSTFTSAVHNDVQLVGIGDVERRVDPRTDPTGLQGLTPTTYEIYAGSAAAAIGHPERNLLNLQVGANHLNYDPLQGSTGPIVTSDRNNTEIYGEASFRHTVAPRRSLYLKVRPNVRDYDQKFDQAGFQRSSDGVRIDTGVDWDIDSAFLVSAETGYQRQSYDDPRFGTIGEPDGRINLSWWPTRLTNVTLNGIHEYYEAFFIPSPGAVRNKVIGRIDHELRRRWVASASFSVERDDLKDVPTHYTTEIADLTLKYLFADGFSGGIDYLFVHQTTTGSAAAGGTATGSTAAGTGSSNFQQNIVTFSIKKVF